VTGYRRDEIIGRTGAELEIMPLAERNRVLEAVMANNGSIRDCEISIRTKTGESRTVLLSLEIVEFPEGKCTMSLLFDLTERKKAENALLFHQALLNETGEIAKVGGWSIDAVTGAGYWTDEVARIHDLDPADPISKDVGITFYKGESRVLIESAVNEAIENATPYDLELELTTAAGTHKWIRTIGHPVVKNGKVVEVRGSFQDISDRRHAEEEIRKLNAELEQRVELRTAQLKTANEELEAFSYSVSHDLRSPLRAMSGFSDALLEDFGSQMPEDAQKFARTIRNAAHRMGALIDDLLTFSRIGRTSIRTEPVEMRRLVEDVFENLRTERGERKIEFRCEEMGSCVADPALLRQVWVNLISNAIKFTGKREDALIEVSCKKGDADETIYQIADNGTGFNMEYSDKLFGVFQRLHRADEYQGTGVGLAIVSRIIKRHGGLVWADAKVNEGATFYFTVPGETE